MDKFAWGAIIIAVIIEAFLVYATFQTQDWTTNRPLATRNLLLASLLPLILIGTIFLFYWLQKGET